MFDKLKKNWNLFKTSKPGQRFKERYQRLSKKRQKNSTLRSVFNISLGVLIIIIGIILWFIPGPGWATVFIGAAIIAGESIMVARFLDFIEIKARKLMKDRKINKMFKHENTGNQ
jgi:uncharacterized protein (TIGR02611 family)